MRDDRIGAVIEAMAPDWMRVAEAAHREDRPGRHECQRAAGSEIDVEPREPPRSRFPRRGEGRAIEMAFDAAIADDHRPEERRVGKGWVRTVRSGWSPYH